MKRVYSVKDPLMVSHLKNVLETYGVECVVRNTFLGIAAGEIPPTDCWPELWVVDENRSAEARSILEKTLAPLKAIRKPWTCPHCGEEIEGQFSECWNCGKTRS